MMMECWLSLFSIILLQSVCAGKSLAYNRSFGKGTQRDPFGSCITSSKKYSTPHIVEVKIGDQLQESGENVFVGGKNRWKYSAFVNWELWWPNFPVLVYFKETQTKPEGQVHFFPVIFNGKQLYDVLVERAGPSKTSSPK